MLTAWLALSVAACGGKTMVSAQSSPDASGSGGSAINFGAPADAASEASKSADAGSSAASGGVAPCVAAGGQCELTVTLGSAGGCLGQVSTLSCGERAGAGFFCCLPLNLGPPVEAGITLLPGSDASDSGEQDAGDCVAVGGTCVGVWETCMGVAGGQSCPNMLGASAACCLPEKLDCGLPDDVPIVCPGALSPCSDIPENACLVDGGVMCPGTPSIFVEPGDLQFVGQGPPVLYPVGCTEHFPFCSNGLPFQCTCVPPGVWDCDADSGSN